MIEKLRQMMFGKKSEKVILKLEQLEFELEEEETTQAVMEAVLDRVSPARDAKARPERKPLPEHLEREVIPHVPGRDGCPDCGGRLRQFGEDRSRRTRRQGLYLRLPAGHRALRSREEDRKGEHPRHHLKNFTGALQADAYAGFHHLYGNHIYEAACWAHARRKFHEIHVMHASPTTTEALARIGALYAIEEEIRGKPADLRLSIRQSRARPLLDELRTWKYPMSRIRSSRSGSIDGLPVSL
jgi:Transposase IS66 family/Transposase C of IS166 homeodomain